MPDGNEVKVRRMYFAATSEQSRAECRSVQIVV